MGMGREWIVLPLETSMPGESLVFDFVISVVWRMELEEKVRRANMLQL
jgi:hypothetical protein